ncbi:glycine zipper 2TM domain-containing protein [Acidovorax sp. SUPP3334]|uniref:glycine zipper 2TM domain-containing protein n=1 Tax=Acidovorax sp. SUPP3334 TaxID=2920881 RepID=UPI0023DE6758|nr:glycine zipper 2TM domain-containing protein [Acidovorax sp. SUPP3334]GKT25559.1 glycine zipper 2TM domain-containing protein [Acidovorax sp. SUPP3334]
MSLIIRNDPSLTPSTGTHASAAAGGASVKWLWAAVGALGVSVLALGATLVVQQRGNAPAEPAAQVAQLAPGAQRTPESEVINERAGAAPARPVQPLAQNIVNRAPVQAQTGSGSGGGYGSGNGYGGGYDAPASAGRPVAMQAPVCNICGRVESVQAVQQAAPATGVGAVAGGVLGAVVGNQVGKGSGRTAATVLGAVGGGYLGHTVEQRTRTTTAYQMRVRMEDGSVRTFTRSQPVAEGTPMRVEGRNFRVDSRASSQQGEGSYT